MKILNGSELADYIKVRQLSQSRNLRQAHGVQPKLAIVQTVDNPVIDKYVGLKQNYGRDIEVEVEIFKTSSEELLSLIDKLNADESIHGIIIQLPPDDPAQTEAAVNSVAPSKDVDGLGVDGQFDPATPTAINWLLTGYNVDLSGKNIVIVGKGRLVGQPLAKMWQSSGHKVEIIDKKTESPKKNQLLKNADIIVSSAGSPGIITSDLVHPGAVVVDAGTASEDGKIVGDVDDKVRERHDLSITPKIGGVGPLTVAALFDNVLRAARATIS